MTPSEAAIELIARRKARRSFKEYMAYCAPNYKWSYFSEAVCDAVDKFIEDVLESKRPILVLAAPPQHGKSELISRRLPAYLTARFPDWKIAAASYSDDLAGAMAQDVRRNVSLFEHQKLFPNPLIKGKFDLSRVSEFTSPGGTGSYLGVGVGAGLTGRTATCLVAGSLVETDRGAIPIEKFNVAGKTCKVLSYRNGGLYYEKVTAFTSSKRFGLWKIRTARGRFLEVTGNHEFYTSRGYVAADKLTEGEILLSAVLKVSDDHSSGLQETKSKILFSRMRWFKQARYALLQRLRQSIAARIYGRLLQTMSKFSTNCEKQVLCKIRKGIGSLPDVPKSVRINKSHQRKIFNVLRENLRGQGTCGADVRQRKSKMEKRSAPFARTASFSKSLSYNTSWYFIARRLRLCFMQIFGRSVGGSSYRRESDQQSIIEFGNTLCQMPQSDTFAHEWRTETDYVVSITRSDKEAIVFDIQVENSHNFFANGILVHNCGIIDDAVKNEKEALSETVKAAHWNWYMATFSTRLSENSGQIIIGTSWAINDLPSRICTEFRGDPRLTVLRFPAINLPGEVGYNPQLPEGALVPELHSLEKLYETKSLLSDYWWASLYQQTPRALGGNVFKEIGLKYYLLKELPEKFDKIVASMDAAFKESDDTDFVVIQVWAKKGAMSYLLDQVRARMSFTKSVDAVKKIKEKWPNIREFYIEDKANGPAIIDTLRPTIPCLIPIEPDGSKLARAHAVTSYWEAGNIWLPHPDLFPWVKDLVDELTAFPASANDDSVDSLTMAIRQLYPVFGQIRISQEVLKAAMMPRRNMI